MAKDLIPLVGARRGPFRAARAKRAARAVAPCYARAHPPGSRRRSDRAGAAIGLVEQPSSPLDELPDRFMAATGLMTRRIWLRNPAAVGHKVIILYAPSERQYTERRCLESVKFGAGEKSASFELKFTQVCSHPPFASVPREDHPTKHHGRHS